MTIAKAARAITGRERRPTQAKTKSPKAENATVLRSTLW